MTGKSAEKSHRKYLLGFVIAPLVIGVLASYADSKGRFERLNGIAWDYFKSQSQVRAPDSRILVIEIDDKTETAFGWPLERQELGQVVIAAQQHGAQVVGFDMLFTQDSEWGEDDDSAFAQAVNSAQNVVLPSFKQEPLIEVLTSSQPRVSHPFLDVGDDGVVRRVPFTLSSQAEVSTPDMIALGVEMMRAAAASSNTEKFSSGTGYIHFKNQTDWRRQSFLDVLNLIQTQDAEKLEELFKGAFVLVGVTAKGRHDKIYVPSVGEVATVYGHANVLDNALNDDFLLHFASRSKLVQRALYICFVLLLSAAALYLRPKFALGLFVFSFLLLWFGGYFLFVEQAVLLDVAGPSFVLVFALLFSGPNLTRDLRQALDVQERFAAELQMKVQERTAELEEQTRVANALHADAQRYAAELEVLDKQKTSFFQNMSHELRTPLTLILNPLEEASKRYSADDDLRVAINNARRLLRLVNQLLDFQKLDAGRKKLNLRPINLNQFIRVCGDYFNSACSTKGIEFAICIDEPARVVEADPDALEKIVFNYLSNALKFTDPGGSIELGLESVGTEPTVKVFVRDSGNGIKAEDQEKLFEVFGQIEDSTTREYEGTGLGLALAKSLAEEMGASVGVESRWGEGAKFYASFPLIEKPVAELAEIKFSQKQWLLADKGATGVASEVVNDFEDHANERAEQYAKILVVDDLMDMRELIAKTLKAQGYGVLKAAHGEQGFEILMEHRPDLVISDWMMPKLSGPDLVAKIRETPEVAGTPCILLTAKSDEESKLIGTQIGADVFLGKPFNSKELVSTVRNLVALKAKEKEVVELNHYITESVLKRYLPPSLITEIVAGRLSMDKPAELRPITVLFSDLVGFTKTSEALGPELIAAFLNAYFTKMNEVIFEHEGTIDKFIGDAIMVMFGAPNDVPSDKQAHLAVACATAMQREMSILCEQWQHCAAGQLEMRIGVHQGPAVVGNFGSDQRSDYTCIGPTVNLAARIEAAAVAGATLVSNSVRSHFSDAEFMPAGEYELKGFKDKQELYRVVGS